jgi:hypothetical protein
MVRRASRGALLTALFCLALSGIGMRAAPIRLARHPDFHAGRITFSYLGDIWLANEDGSSTSWTKRSCTPS